LISATGIFFVGCGITIYHGISIILNPHPIHNYLLNFIVLFFALIIEGAVLFVALKYSVQEAKKKKQKLMTYFFRNSDTMAVAVVLEESAAIVGIFVAAGGIILSYYTGNFIWDGIATLIIGLILGFVALALITKTKGLLLGRAVFYDERKRTVGLLKDDDDVHKIYDVKSMIIGSNEIRFKAEIDFNGKVLTKKFLKKNRDLQVDFDSINSKGDLEKYLIEFGDGIVDKVGKEINRIEIKIHKSNPDIKHIDLEAH
jgi:zinc transporter 9